MDITYYDIGLNLFTRSFPRPERILADAAADGICCILTGSEDRENRKVDTFVKNHHAYGTAGIHPHAADEAREEDIEEIRRIVTTNPKVVAVGETGLDYDRMYSTKENQLHYFKELIVLAEELDKTCFFMNGTLPMISFPALPVMKAYAPGPSSTAIPVTERRWRRCSIWVFISALPDGYAMNGVPMTCAMPYRSFPLTGCCWRQMRRI